MALDVFNPAATDQNVMMNAAADLPAGFSEAFDISLRSIGEWHNSNAYEVARDRALATFYDDVKTKTGVQLPLYGMGGNVSLDELNTAIGRLPQAPPGEIEPSYHPLTETDIDSMALSRMRRARSDAAAFARRETTLGGSFGTIAGTLTGGLSDPIAAVTLPLGGAGELGMVARSLEFAAIAGGTEAASSLTALPARERAVPGSAHEIPGEIAWATLFGAGLGAGVGALQKLIGLGARPLPTTIRDDVNAAASEAQFNLTNPFPTAAGEAAARDATVDATRSAVRGEPVTVADSFAPAHVEALSNEVKAATPEELALAGERHLRPETFDQVPDVERFDRMPAAAEDAASYWENRLAGATPEERAALGATDGEAHQRIAAPDLAPAQLDALAAEPKTIDAAAHDLDHVVAANPEAEFTTQTRMPDGSYTFQTQKLSDVLKDLDGWESAAKELEACVIGLEAAE